MSINRSGETTVELATQSRKSFVCLRKFKLFGQFYVLLEGLCYYYKNNMISIKITQLVVTNKSVIGQLEFRECVRGHSDFEIFSGTFYKACSYIVPGILGGPRKSVLARVRAMSRS